MKKNNVFSRLKDNICTFFKKDKKSFIMLLICFTGIIVLFISSVFNGKNKRAEVNKETVVSVTSYAEKIENKIISIISKMDSVTKVDAFVMIEATPEITFLTEKKETTITNEKGSTSEITTTVVFEKNGSVQTPVVITTIMPKITGVMIVTNKIDVSTKLLIKNSLSVVLNIDESCISLLQEN
ncbi:MAG: hypothetical protein IJX17_04190 [Clostridia bacterium]|nr:hypothetical protein [Clostridia bacterium]